MKKIIMIVGVAIASIGFGFAQQGQTQQGKMGQEGTTQEIERGDKEEIDRNELPGQVQNSLRTGEFRDWEVDEVYRVEPETQRETGVAFEVKVKRGDEKMKLHYDMDGKLVGQKRKDKGDKHKGGEERKGSRY